MPWLHREAGLVSNNRFMSAEKAIALDGTKGRSGAMESLQRAITMYDRTGSRHATDATRFGKDHQNGNTREDSP